MKATKKKPAKKVATQKKSGGFTAAERAAMRDRVREMKAEARGAKDRAAGEKEVLARIAKLPAHDRALAKRVHELVTATAPGLMPRTWYGMPAYAKDDKVLCYFQDAHKFKARYATLGFNGNAKLDEGNMWPVVFALKELTSAEEARIVALLKRAIS